MIGAGGVEVIVEQCAGAGAAWVAWPIVRLADHLARQPARRDSQQQALALIVIVHFDAA